MNIKQASETIKNTVKLYLKKDEYGEYRIPVIRQRPVFLLGAPGIGKTAIMEQIAKELSVALVSYSMTHHTRQSALGLPFIAHKEYEGMEYDVSEYTMSEIIASVYQIMEESGIKEGILFLDEINCVSETLAPSMLQFLQYKVFGRHRVPEGWVIVTAGNPPEYNKSVREFDVVTMDRLKILEVEADYPIWKEYAGKKGIHTAVLNFLELKKEYFYKIETTVNGRSYVTARGWEDLSEILFLYEEEEITADETLIGQYLRNERVAKEFSAYYDLFNKYKKEYRIDEILAGMADGQTMERIRQAAFDERLSLLSMLLDKVISGMQEIMETAGYLEELHKGLGAMKGAAEKSDLEIVDMMRKQAEARGKFLNSMEKANSLSDQEKRKSKRILKFLEEAGKQLYVSEMKEGEAALTAVKKKFESEVYVMKKETEQIKEKLENLFVFVEDAFVKGNEMMILLTELTVNEYSAGFISRFGCEGYRRHSDEMMLSERGRLLQEEINGLEL